MIKSLLTAMTVLALTATAAQADVAAYAKAGTLGVGAGLGLQLTSDLTLRAGFNKYTYDDNIEETDITYDGEFRLESGELLLDWHVFGGGFRITTGAYLNRNKLTGTGKPTNGTYEINGVAYDARAIGEIDAEIEFDSVAPYIGIGWGNIMRGSSLTFMADLGAMYQGSPRIKVSNMCTNATNEATCAMIRQGVAAERANLERELDSYKWWPVISLGLAYRF